VIQRLEKAQEDRQLSQQETSLVKKLKAIILGLQQSKNPEPDNPRD
jgi:hypothetical protein